MNLKFFKYSDDILNKSVNIKTVARDKSFKIQIETLGNWVRRSDPVDFIFPNFSDYNTSNQEFNSKNTATEVAFHDISESDAITIAEYVNLLRRLKFQNARDLIFLQYHSQFQTHLHKKIYCVMDVLSNKILDPHFEITQLIDVSLHKCTEIENSMFCQLPEKMKCSDDSTIATNGKILALVDILTSTIEFKAYRYTQLLVESGDEKKQFEITLSALLDK
jgi:hypothetical protein